MGVEICFDGYLRSVISAYQQWWRLYTLTDATGRESQRVDREQIAPAFFDFGLMVQTVEPPKSEQEGESERDREKKEKIERLPVLEGICKYAGKHDLGNHVLLVGRPGSGKSTALARLLWDEAGKALKDQQAKIPVLVELRYLPSEANESSVCDRILAFMHKHDPALDIDETGIKLLLRQGRLLLLVDGVNELPSDRGRTQAIKFRELYQKTCPMIFTTRELSAGGDLGIAKRLEMQPLTEPQMQQFVMAYLPTQGERLLRQLSGRLREFGQTPLLLWMLCSLFQQSEQIPPNLGMVFRAFTVGYGDRIKQDVTLSKDSRTWWGRLLQYLAFKMTCGENLTELQVAISRREAEQFLVEFLRGKVEFADDCAVRWLEDLLKHHLIQISNDRIEFRHQLIQEYYAAEWLRELLPSLSDARLRQVYLNYLKWTEPLALMLELLESEEQAVRVVRLTLEVDLRLGARLAGAVKYGFQEKTVGLLIQEIEKRKVPESYAIDLLGKTKSDFAINVFITEIKGSVSSICKKAVEALGKIGNEKAADVLINALDNFDPTVRLKAAEALVTISNEKVVDALISAFKDFDSNVRRNVAEALGKISNEKAIDALIIALQDSDFYVRRTSEEALDKISSAKAINALQDSGFYVRRTLQKKLLDKIGNERAISAFTIRKSLDAKSNAIERSEEIDNKELITPLIPFFKGSKYYFKKYKSKYEYQYEYQYEYSYSSAGFYSLVHCRIDEVESLAKIGNEQAIDKIIIALDDFHTDIRVRAVDVLATIDNKKAIDAIIIALKNSDSDVRMSAAWALVKIDSEKAIDAIISALNDSNSNVRINLIWALGKIGSEKAVDAIITTLNDANSDARMSAVEVLGKINSEKAIGAIINALSDSNSTVRINAAWTLVRNGNEKGVNILIAALEYCDSSVWKILVDSLVKIGKAKEAIAPLINALTNPNSDVRMNALESLSKIVEIERDLPTLTQQLPHLRNLIFTEASQQALSVITAIQAQCKYYNYDIAQTPLLEENNNDKVLSKPQGNIINVTEIKNDFSGANFGGANIANLGGTVNEQKIVQKTEVPKQSLAEATKEVQNLLNQLAKTNPSKATIADTIQQEIKRNPTLKARLVNALKTGGIEALKAIFNNPFVSIPVETVKGFLEAEE